MSPWGCLRRACAVVPGGWGGGTAASLTRLHSSRRYAGVLLDEDIFRGKELVDSRPLQALVAGLKAYSTWENVSCLQDCRECTGGMVSPAGPRGTSPPGPPAVASARPALCVREQGMSFRQKPVVFITLGASPSLAIRASASYHAARTDGDHYVCKMLAPTAWPIEACSKCHLTWWWLLLTVWGRANEDQMMKALLQCLNPLGRMQEMTPGVSSPRKKADRDVPSIWRLLSMSPALGLRLDCAVRGTRCEKSHFESLES